MVHKINTTFINSFCILHAILMLTHQTLNAKNPTCCTTIAGFDYNAQFRISITCPLLWNDFVCFSVPDMIFFPFVAFSSHSFVRGLGDDCKNCSLSDQTQTFFSSSFYSLFFLFPFWLSEYYVIFIFSKNLTKLGVLVRINYWGEKILLH